MENLFGNLFETEKRQTKPLADRMRPERLSDFVGRRAPWAQAVRCAV